MHCTVLYSRVPMSTVPKSQKWLQGDKVWWGSQRMECREIGMIINNDNNMTIVIAKIVIVMVMQSPVLE